MKYKKSRYDLPLEPPEGLLSWMLEMKMVDAGAIVYKMEYYQDAFGKRRRGVECTCTSCETSFFADYMPPAHPDSEVYGWYNEDQGCAVYNGQQCCCPLCGEAVISEYIGKRKSDVLNLSGHGAVTVERVNGKIAVIWWKAEQLLHGRRIEYKVYPWEAYVFDGKRCVKNVAYITYGFFNRQCYAEEWFERSKCVDTLGNVDVDNIYPFDVHIFDGTELENAKYDIYLKDNPHVYPVSYLRLYQRHNTVENLVMSGSSRLVADILRPDGMHYVAPLSDSDKMINWAARKPAAMLGLTKPEYNALKSMNMHDIEFYLITKDYGVTTDNFRKILGRHEVWYIRMLATEFKENIPRADRYIVKQRKKYHNNVTLSELMDYWRMVEPADRLKDTDVRYPQNLRHSHDELVRLKKWKEDMALREQFEQRYEELSVYSYRNDKLLIRPCRDESELINEGKTLKHCVASYAKRHASGDTSIFFIRHVERPDEPFYTLEWTGRRINQDHGYRNRLQTDEIKKFEKEWLEYVKGVDKNRKYSRKAS